MVGSITICLLFPGTDEGESQKEVQTYRAFIYIVQLFLFVKRQLFMFVLASHVYHGAWGSVGASL